MLIAKHRGRLALAAFVSLSAPAFAQAGPKALPGPTDEQLTTLKGIYEDLHANPELSMQEKRTAGIAAQWLKDQGFEVTERVGGTGVVGILRNGDGPAVLLRADMDGLPMKENTGLPYASTKRGTESARRTVSPTPRRIMPGSREMDARPMTS